MDRINFVKNLFLDRRGVYALDSKGEKTRVFLRQGDLDCECVTYSAMMLLILMQKLKMHDLSSYKCNKNSSLFVKLLRRTFLYTLNGLEGGGRTFKGLKYKLEECEPDFDTKIYISDIEITDDEIPKKELDYHIEQYLTNGCPIQIAYYNFDTKCRHSIVAVGISKIDSCTSKIYCLDPGFPEPTGAMWNLTIDIHSNDVYDYMGDFKVIVNQAFVINTNVDLFELPF